MDEIIEIIKSFGSLILAAVVAIIAYRHNKLSREISNDNLQKQLFTELNKRYDSLNEVLQTITSHSLTSRHFQFFVKNIPIKEQADKV